jgi:hypothetical protein
MNGNDARSSTGEIANDPERLPIASAQIHPWPRMESAANDGRAQIHDHFEHHS